MFLLLCEISNRNYVVSVVAVTLLTLALIVLPCKPWVTGYWKRQLTVIGIFIKWYLETTVLVIWGMICACTPLRMSIKARKKLRTNCTTALTWYFKILLNGAKGLVFLIYAPVARKLPRTMAILVTILLLVIII